MINYLIKDCSVCTRPDEILSHLLSVIESNHSFLPVVTLNMTMFPDYFRESDLFDWLKQHALFTPDGISISVLILFRYFRWEPRYPGIDMVHQLLQRAEPLRVAMIGSDPRVLTLATTHFLKTYGNHSLVFSKDGFSEFTAGQLNDLNQLKPQLVLVAMGCPKQDHMIKLLSKELTAGVAIGVGGVFDVWSGTVRRAPKLIQTFGLEWLYRIVQTPARVRRILTALVYLGK